MAGEQTTSPSSEAPAKKRRTPLVRELVLADLITLGNAAAGTGAILACTSYTTTGEPTWLNLVGALLVVALVCDVLDGSVARWRHRHSPYGADLDSLSDLISFGVAPAVLAFTLGARTPVDVVVLVFFVACGVGRLARFNATADDLMTDAGKVRYFEGTPIPSTLLLVVMMLALARADLVHENLWAVPGPLGFHLPVIAYALSGLAMISTRLRIPKP
ncbi:MAG: CDP-alcohol phosphatidyltransferase family protein [Myxococcota bacterium]